MPSPLRWLAIVDGTPPPPPTPVSAVGGGSRSCDPALKVVLGGYVGTMGPLKVADGRSRHVGVDDEGATRLWRYLRMQFRSASSGRIQEAGQVHGERQRGPPAQQASEV